MVKPGNKPLTAHQSITVCVTHSVVKFHIITLGYSVCETSVLSLVQIGQNADAVLLGGLQSGVKRNISMLLTLLIVKSRPGLPEQTPVKQYLSLQ